MMDSMGPIQSLTELQAKFQQEPILPFDAETLLGMTRDSGGNSESIPSGSCMEYCPFDPNEPCIAKIIDYRREKVAAFELNGKDMICLPQVYELFLKNMVGGLHTVYTKLKRLEINPIICNVEQVRSLRSLGAIQTGVNRCKLIAIGDFDRLYEDCTNTCTRPGRPPKRGSCIDEWTSSSSSSGLKKEKYDGIDPSDYPMSTPSSALSSPLFLGNFFPQFNAHQLIVQHMMAMAAAQKPNTQGINEMRAEDSNDLSMERDVSEEADGGTPLNLTKTNSSSDNDTDSIEALRKEDESLSPNQSSERGGSMGSNSNTSSSSSDQSSIAVTKIISLIDMANEHFKKEKEDLAREKSEVEQLRNSLKSSLMDEDRLRTQLDAEKKKTHLYIRRYNRAHREMIALKEEMLEFKRRQSVEPL